MRVSKIAAPLLVLAGAVIIFAGFKLTAKVSEPLRVREQTPVVSVQVVMITTASPTVKIFGQVEAPGISVLTAGVEADIIAVNVLEGDSVSLGQEMIVMDAADADLEVLQRQAELAEIEALIASDKIKLRADKDALVAEELLLALAHKAVERADRLARSQAGSFASLDLARGDEQRQLLSVAGRQQAIDDFVARQQQLRARADKATAILKRAMRDRRRTRVTAPFAGRITEVMVAIGERASRTTRLIELYDESNLELRAQVPSVYVAGLRRAFAAGQAVAAEINAIWDDSDKRMPLTLHRMSARVGEQQGGVDAFFRAHDGRLPVPGDTLAITLHLPPMENVIVLSPDALYGSDRVYLVRDNLLHAQRVRRLGQLRDSDGRQRLIIAGDEWKDGDQILNSRLPQAVSGLKVTVMPE